MGHLNTIFRYLNIKVKTIVFLSFSLTALTVMADEITEGIGGRSALSSQSEQFNALITNQYAECQGRHDKMLEVAGLEQVGCQNYGTDSCSRHQCIKRLVGYNAFQSEIQERKRESEEDINESKYRFLYQTVLKSLAENDNKSHILGFESDLQESLEGKPGIINQYCGLNSIDSIKSRLMQNESCAGKMSEAELKNALSEVFKFRLAEGEELDKGIFHEKLKMLFDKKPGLVSASEKERIKGLFENQNISSEELYNEISGDVLSALGLEQALNPNFSSFQGDSSAGANCFQGRHLEFLSSVPSVSEIEYFLDASEPNGEGGFSDFLARFAHSEITGEADNGQATREISSPDYYDDQRLIDFISKEPSFKIFLEMDPSKEEQLSTIQSTLENYRSYLENILPHLRVMEDPDQAIRGTASFKDSAERLKRAYSAYYDPNGPMFGSGNLERSYDNYCNKAVNKMVEAFCEEPDPFKNHEALELRSSINDRENEVDRFVTQDLVCELYQGAGDSNQSFRDGIFWINNQKADLFEGSFNEHSASVASLYSGDSINTSEEDGRQQSSPVANFCQIMRDQFQEGEPCADPQNFMSDMSECRRTAMERIMLSSEEKPEAYQELFNDPMMRKLLTGSYAFGELITESPEREGAGTTMSRDNPRAANSATLSRGNWEVESQGSGSISQSSAREIEGSIASEDSGEESKSGPSSYEVQDNSSGNYQRASLGRAEQQGFSQGAYNNRMLASEQDREERASQLDNDKQRLLDKIASLEERLSAAESGATDSDLDPEGDQQGSNDLGYLRDEIERLREQSAETQRTVDSLRDEGSEQEAPSQVPYAAPAEIPFDLSNFVDQLGPRSGNASSSSSQNENTATQGSQGAQNRNNGIEDSEESTASRSARGPEGSGAESSANEGSGLADGLALNVDRGSLQVVKADESYLDLLRDSAASNPQRFFEYLQELGVSDQAFVIQDPNDESKEYLVRYSEENGRIVLNTEAFSEQVASEDSAESDRAPASADESTPEDDSQRSGFYEQLLEDATTR